MRWFSDSDRAFIESNRAFIESKRPNIANSAVLSTATDAAIRANSAQAIAIMFP